MPATSTATAPRRQKSNARGPSPQPSIGSINAGSSYTKRQFIAATGLGLKSFRDAMRDGLPVKSAGRNYYILGSDWLAWLASRPNVEGAGTAAAKGGRTN